jgi:hypothetical protein
LTGDGTAGRCGAYRLTRGQGWRIVGRGLVIGGFLLGGWLFSTSGHAYAAEVTAPSAPHNLPAGSQEAGASPALQLAGANRPASALLSTLGLPGNSSAVSSGQTALGSLAAPAVSDVSGVLTSEVHQGATLATGLEGPTTTGLVTGTASALPRVPPAVLDGEPAVVPGTGTDLAGATRVTRPLTGRAHLAARGEAKSALPNDLSGRAVALATNSTRDHAGRTRHHGNMAVTARHHRTPRRNVPGGRLGTGAATQTDPISSSGGTGTAQTAATQAPLGSIESWSPPGTLVRTRMSRRPAGRLEVDDPAVSPD